LGMKSYLLRSGIQHREPEYNTASGTWGTCPLFNPHGTYSSSDLAGSSSFGWLKMTAKRRHRCGPRFVQSVFDAVYDIVPNFGHISLPNKPKVFHLRVKDTVLHTSAQLDWSIKAQFCRDDTLKVSVLPCGNIHPG